MCWVFSDDEHGSSPSGGNGCGGVGSAGPWLSGCMGSAWRSRGRCRGRPLNRLLAHECGTYHAGQTTFFLAGRAWVHLYAESMSPGGHLVTTLALSAASTVLTRELPLADSLVLTGGLLVGGFLIDV